MSYYAVDFFLLWIFFLLFECCEHILWTEKFLSNLVNGHLISLFSNLVHFTFQMLDSDELEKYITEIEKEREEEAEKKKQKKWNVEP